MTLNDTRERSTQHRRPPTTIARCHTRPVAHVARRMGISRTCALKWVNRWRRHVDAGLLDRSSTPHRSPTATPACVIEQIETWATRAQMGRPAHHRPTRTRRVLDQPSDRHPTPHRVGLGVCQGQAGRLCRPRSTERVAGSGLRGHRGIASSDCHDDLAERTTIQVVERGRQVGERVVGGDSGVMAVRSMARTRFSSARR